MIMTILTLGHKCDVMTPTGGDRHGVPRWGVDGKVVIASSADLACPDVPV